MLFEWDEEKRISNLLKHGFDFTDAETVFEGEIVTIDDDRFEYAEQRFVTLGLLNGKVVSIVHTERREKIRVISIRKASRDEERKYFKHIYD